RQARDADVATAHAAGAPGAVGLLGVAEELQPLVDGLVELGLLRFVLLGVGLGRAGYQGHAEDEQERGGSHEDVLVGGAGMPVHSNPSVGRRIAPAAASAASGLSR